jgi:hypothetical protein
VHLPPLANLSSAHPPFLYLMRSHVWLVATRVDSAGPDLYSMWSPSGWPLRVSNVFDLVFAGGTYSLSTV